MKSFSGPRYAGARPLEPISFRPEPSPRESVRLAREADDALFLESFTRAELISMVRGLVRPELVEGMPIDDPREPPMHERIIGLIGQSKRNASAVNEALAEAKRRGLLR